MYRVCKEGSGECSLDFLSLICSHHLRTLRHRFRPLEACLPSILIHLFNFMIFTGRGGCVSLLWPLCLSPRLSNFPKFSSIKHQVQRLNSTIPPTLAAWVVFNIETPFFKIRFLKKWNCHESLIFKKSIFWEDFSNNFGFPPEKTKIFFCKVIVSKSNWWIY